MKLEQVSERDFIVHYSRGVKRNTRFEIASTAGGSRLRITDDYSGAAAPDTAEVDRSLHAWGVALREYLLRERRWGWCAPWRWYMRRVWVPMKPVARRITFLILMVTLAEIAQVAQVSHRYGEGAGRDLAPAPEFEVGVDAVEAFHVAAKPGERRGRERGVDRYPRRVGGQGRRIVHPGCGTTSSGAPSAPTSFSTRIRERNPGEPFGRGAPITTMSGRSVAA